MTKAITYYRLKEDEIGSGLTKTNLITETAEMYQIPNSVLRRRVNDKLTTDEGQGEGN